MAVAPSQILAQLTSASLLQVVPGLSDLVSSKGRVIVVEKNTAVVKQGSPPKFLIMPLSHGLRLTQRIGENPARPVGYLEKHDALGLRELVEGRPYDHTAVTEASTSMVVVPVAEFVALVRKQPAVERYLRLITVSAGVREFKKFLLEKGISHDEATEIIATISDVPKAVAQGETLPPAASLCFVSRGTLRITTGDDANAKAVTVIREGAFFGGEALVSPFVWSYEVKATMAATLHMAPVETMRKVLAGTGVIDSLYDEPCLFTKGDESTRVSLAPKTTTLPGELLDPTTLTHLMNFEPELLQQAAGDADSAVSSVVNIAQFLTLGVSISNVSIDLHGSHRFSWLNVAEVLEPLGTVCSPVKVTGKRLDGRQFPLLLNMGQRLVVGLAYEGKTKTAIMHDPVRGFVRVKHADLAKLWDGECLEVRRSEYEPELEKKETVDTDDANATPKDDKKEAALLIAWKILNQHRRMLATISGLSLIGVGIGALTPYFSRVLLDNVLTLRDRSVLVGCVIGTLLVSLMGLIVSIAEARVVSEFSISYDRLFSIALYRRALSLPMKFFSKYKASDILTRLGELEHIRHFLSEQVLGAIISAFSLIVYTAVLAAFNWQAAMLAVAIAMFTAAVQWLVRKSLRRNYKSIFNAHRESTTLLSEQVAAIATVKATHAETAMQRRWEGAYLRSAQLSFNTSLVQAGTGTITGLLSQTARIGGLWLAARQALSGSLSPGQVLAISMYLSQVVGAVIGIGGFLSQIDQLLVSLSNVGKLFTKQTDTSDASTKMSVALKGKIRVERLNFRYDDKSDWVLRDLTFNIYPQQIVAIVGRSGCGKTTLAHLLAGNLKATSGRVFFDNYDAAFLSPNSLAKQIGFVMQANDLFQATIGENIAYGDDSPEFDQVTQMADQAAAMEFIVEQPGDFNKHLGEGGLGLSGGQKQRLSLARTLYRKPKILILDEATSALDARSEQAIVKNMRDIMSGKTAIVIAHRLSTIRHADLILVMRDGAIVEQGTHKDLLEQGGHYAELFEGQSRAAEAS